MKCQYCGNEIEAGKKFCKHCGRKVIQIETSETVHVPGNGDKSEPQKATFCYKCGNRLAPGEKFCGKCGTKVDSFEEPQRETYVEPERETYVEPERETYVEPQYEDDKEESKPEEQYYYYDEQSAGKKKGGLGLILGIVCAVVLVAAAATIGSGVFIKGNFVTDALHISKSASDAEVEEADKEVESEEILEEDKEETEAVIETETEFVFSLGQKKETEASPSNTDVNNGSDSSNSGSVEPLDLEFLDADYKYYPGGVDDFASAFSPDGVYSFKYPKNFFKTGTYDAATKTFRFESADGNNVLTITEKTSDVIGDPKASAEHHFYTNVAKVVEADYEKHPKYAPPKVEYSRSIFAGYLANNPDMRLYEICCCGPNDITYVLSYTYLSDIDNPDLPSPEGYVIDCIYRGWSISGCTYKMREKDVYYEPDNMGEKKENWD